MHEEFDFCMDGTADGADLLQGQFPFQDQTAEAQALQPPRLLRRPECALSGSMHDQTVAHSQHSRVLYDEGVYPGLFQGFHQFAGLRDFLRF